MIPWKEIAATISKVFTLTQEVQKIKVDAKETRDELEELERKVTHVGQQMNELTFSFQRVYYEIQRLQMRSGIFVMTASAGTRMPRGNGKT